MTEIRIACGGVPVGSRGREEVAVVCKWAGTCPCVEGGQRAGGPQRRAGSDAMRTQSHRVAVRGAAVSVCWCAGRSPIDTASAMKAAADSRGFSKQQQGRV